MINANTSKVGKLVEEGHKAKEDKEPSSFAPICVINGRKKILLVICFEKTRALLFIPLGHLGKGLSAALHNESTPLVRTMDHRTVFGSDLHHERSLVQLERIDTLN